MNTVKCPNPECGAEYPPPQEGEIVCPFCGTPANDGHSKGIPKSKMYILGGIAAIAVLTGLVAMVVSFFGGGEGEQASPPPVVASTSSEPRTPEPTPTPATPAPTVEETSTSTPTPEPSPSPSPTPSPTPSPSAKPSPTKKTPPPDAISDKVKDAIARAEKYAQNGEFSRAVNVLEQALDDAVFKEGEKKLKELIALYRKLRKRQVDVIEAGRQYSNGHYIKCYCLLRRAEIYVKEPLEKQALRMKADAAAKIFGSPFSTDIGYEFVPFEGATFEMGTENGAQDEQPVHEVTLSPYWLATFETTNALYAEAIDTQVVDAPYRLHAGESAWDREDGLDNLKKEHPVVGVTWTDAMEYCRWLTTFERKMYRLPEFMAFTLPTEAQWEYAAGGPEHSLYPWIGGPDNKYALFGKFGAYGVEKVKTRRPNPSGLFDMAGNAAEWCWDYYGPYPEEPVTDPAGPDKGKHRVVRGGSYLSDKFGVRTTARMHARPTLRASYLGFRLALVVSDPAAWKKAAKGPGDK
ncbi:MAG: SUMF1/EgtB/PvdO family nonheme iron enzyme [Planctomycetota bacterium]|nr:SUMF1/EgtB/PvdO family nonheme iron enzyme [Planctomycetota bacterium]